MELGSLIRYLHDWDLGRFVLLQLYGNLQTCSICSVLSWRTYYTNTPPKTNMNPAFQGRLNWLSLKEDCRSIIVWGVRMNAVLVTARFRIIWTSPQLVKSSYWTSFQGSVRKLDEIPSKLPSSWPMLCCSARIFCPHGLVWKGMSLGRWMASAPVWWAKGWPRERVDSLAEAELLSQLAVALKPRTKIGELFRRFPAPDGWGGKYLDPDLAVHGVLKKKDAALFVE